jgi:hypothetical protein
VTASKYVTAARIDELRQSLSNRSLAIVSDIARVNVATAHQLRRLHFPDSEPGRRMARRELARLADYQVLARLDRRIGGVRAGSDGHIYALGIAGQRLVFPTRDRYRSPWTPQAFQLRHALAVTELYVGLRALEPPGLSATYVAEPACWRTFAGSSGGPQVLKPDAAVTVESPNFDDRYFIEVDRGTEASTRIASKAKVYLQYHQSGREQAEHGVFPKVVWVAPDEPRASQLRRTLERADRGAGLFATTTDEQAAAGLMSGAFINQGEEVP